MIRKPLAVPSATFGFQAARTAFAAADSGPGIIPLSYVPRPELVHHVVTTKNAEAQEKFDDAHARRRVEEVRALAPEIAANWRGWYDNLRSEL